MVTKEFKEACTEINEIFKFLDKSKVEKIPCEIRNTFNKFQSREYVSLRDKIGVVRRRFCDI